MNIWRRTSLTENPYYRTAFRLARVPREVVRHKLIVQIIGQTRRTVCADPQAHVVAGEPVTEAMINAAEAILLDPQKRIAEELLEHAAEKPALEPVRKLLAEVDAALAGDEADTLPVVNLDALRPWTTSLVRQFLSTQSVPDPSFGARELELIPPFGRTQED